LAAGRARPMDAPTRDSNGERRRAGDARRAAGGAIPAGMRGGTKRRGMVLNAVRGYLPAETSSAVSGRIIRRVPAAPRPAQGSHQRRHRRGDRERWRSQMRSAQRSDQRSAPRARGRWRQCESTRATEPNSIRSAPAKRVIGGAAAWSAGWSPAPVFRTFAAGISCPWRGRPTGSPHGSGQARAGV
jgi:hypothetical protein